LKAKQAEILNWQTNGVYDEVENEVQTSISVRRVITEKLKEGNTVIKARLVARGFEQDMHDQKTDPPTCSEDSLRLAMRVIASNGWRWTVNSIDVRAAFLQGEEINRYIYIRPPKEFYSGSLWRQKKTVYGLCDAARAWYFRIKKALLGLKMVMCSLDRAFFYWFDDQVLSGIICIHVDDFCWAGVKSFEAAVIGPLRKEFLIGSHCSKNFKYVGVNLTQNDNFKIQVDQLCYIRSLDEINISPEKALMRFDNLRPNEKDEFRALIGQLNWVSTQTRPDIAFEVCQLSSILESPKVDDLLRANKVVKKIKSEDVSLSYRKLTNIGECSIECYSDASFGNLTDGGSQGGYIVFIVDDIGRRCPVTWQSRRIRRVVKSTLAAETLALLDSAEAGLYVARMLAES
jgi:hypothetical protein